MIWYHLKKHKRDQIFFHNGIRNLFAISGPPAVQRAAGPDPEAELVARPRRGARGVQVPVTVPEVGVFSIVAPVPQPHSTFKSVDLSEFCSHLSLGPAAAAPRPLLVTVCPKSLVPVEAAPRHADPE